MARKNLKFKQLLKLKNLKKFKQLLSPQLLSLNIAVSFPTSLPLPLTFQVAAGNREWGLLYIQNSSSLSLLPLHAIPLLSRGSPAWAAVLVRNLLQPGFFIHGSLDHIQVLWEICLHSLQGRTCPSEASSTGWRGISAPAPGTPLPPP